MDTAITIDAFEVGDCTLHLLFIFLPKLKREKRIISVSLLLLLQARYSISQLTRAS